MEPVRRSQICEREEGEVSVGMKRGDRVSA